MSSDTPPVESAQDIQVRLKPVLGVEPKYYLAVLYGLLILALLFAVAVWPGLSNPGTRVTFTSEPSGAAVVWGEKHWGTTPVTVYLPEGKAALTLLKPGFAPSSREYTSGSQLFFSLFFPRSDTVTVALEPASATSVADRYRSEVGRWALAAPFTSDYRFPPWFTRLAEDAKAAGWDAERTRTFLLALRASVADPQMYADYGRALGLWGAKDSLPGLEEQFNLWKPLVGEDARLALWLLANQAKPVRDRETAEPSDWLQARVAEFQAALKAAPASSAAPPPSLKTAFGTFRGVGASEFLWGSMGTSFSLPTEAPYSLPVPAATAAFWMADAEVTQAQFAAFVAANPAWARTDSNYAPAEPVASVSWSAAQAYVDWLNSTGQVPSGKKAVLPDDLQWEAAARSTGGAALLNQGVWEWTSSSWYPGQSLVGVPATDRSAYAHSLKGGVANAKGSVKAGDRAGWPASDSTPGLGFRLALISVP